jgi:hypothetical protein
MFRLPLATASAAAGAAAKRGASALSAVAGVGSQRHICEKLFIGGE